jgi:hypothetical protein
MVKKGMFSLIVRLTFSQPIGTECFEVILLEIPGI